MAITSETNTNEDVIIHDIINVVEEDETYYAYALQLINSFSVQMVMKVTIDMGVLQLIHAQQGQGLSSKEIATMLQIQNKDAPSMLDRMLRLLAAYSVVRCSLIPNADGGQERRYGPSPMTKFLVPDADNVSLAPLLDLFIDKVFLQSWDKLKEAVLEGGIPFNMVHGMHAFEYPGVDSRFNDVFNQAMYQTTTFIIKKILEKYNGLDNVKRLIDVGGGLGHTLRIIKSQYPAITAVNFDLPHVIRSAPPCPGVENVGGDMFESVPKGDAIILKWILHDWSDEHCLKLLKNCYKTLGEKGKVIVIEAIMTDDAESTYSARAISQIDIHMMTQNPGGKERSREEFKALAKGAGFGNIKFDCCVFNFWVMELYK